MIPLDASLQESLESMRREAIPFLDELGAGVNEAAMGILRPSQITDPVAEQDFLPFDHAIGQLLVPPGADPGVPRGCFTLIELPGDVDPRTLLDQLAIGMAASGRPVLVLPARPYDPPEGSRVLLVGGGWGGNHWTGLRITLGLELGVETGQVVLVEDASVFDNPVAGLWLLHHLREWGHTIVSLGSGLKYLPHVVDYVMASERRSMTSKDLASQWGASYRDRIWIATMVKSVSPSWDLPVRLEFEDGRLVLHSGTPDENMPRALEPVSAEAQLPSEVIPSPPTTAPEPGAETSVPEVDVPFLEREPSAPVVIKDELNLVGLKVAVIGRFGVPQKDIVHFLHAKGADVMASISNKCEAVVAGSGGGQARQKALDLELQWIELDQLRELGFGIR